MTDKFWGFKWNQWKDKKPEVNKYVYVYCLDNKELGVFICLSDDFLFDDNDYWVYVYMPDAPKIEKTKLKPCNVLKDCSNDYILALEKRIEELERKK
jgi:hypothetical protein